MQLVTQIEKEKLQGELKRYIDMRPVISKAIAEAREKGDLKENADYHAAREEYAMNESRIKNLEERVRASTVVSSDDVPEGMVFLGSLLKVKDLKTGDIETLRIVGDVGKINLDSLVMEVSAKSPLGEALMRTRVGQVINVNAPRGGVLANSVTVVLADAGRMCIRALAPTHVVFDTTGWWS